jgi:hypothetical protein
MAAIVVCRYQDHLEVQVDVSWGAKHRPVHHGPLCIEPRRKGDAALVCGDGVPHEDLEIVWKVEEHETVAASEGGGAADIVLGLQGEAPGRDAIGGLQSGYEGQALVPVEQT